MILRSLPVLASAALCVGGLSAQSPFARALPESSVGYISFPDLSTTLGELGEMPLLKTWNEPEVQDFFRSLLEMAEEEFENGLNEARDAYESGMIPIDPDAVLEMRVRSMSVALTELSIAMPSGTTTEEQSMMAPKPRIGFLVQMDFGESIETWKQVLQVGAGALAMQTGMAPTPAEVDGLDVFSLQIDPEDPMGLHYCFSGSNFVLGTLANDVAGVANRMNSEESTGLSGTSSFQSNAQRIDFGGAEFEMFFRPGPGLDFLLQGLDVAAAMAPDFPEEIDIAGVRRVVDALGLRSVDSMSMTSRYVGGTAVTEVYTASPMQNRKGLFAGGSNTVDLNTLRWIPKDAVSFSLGSVDVQGFYNTLMNGVEAYAPGMGDMARDMMAQMEEQIGLSIENDLFGAFGQNYAMWSMPFAGMAAQPEVVVIADMNNQEGFMNSLRTLEQLSEGALSLNPIKRSGLDLFQLRLEIDMGSDALPIPINPADFFTPTFGFKEGKIVMALSSGDVKNALRRMDRDDDANGDIRSNPEFARYIESHIQGNSFESLSFTDHKSSVGGMYQLVASLMAFVPMTPDIPIDPALLPEPSTVTKHMFGGLDYTQSDENGWRSVSIGPFGMELDVLIGGLVGAGIATFGVMSDDIAAEFGEGR